MARAQIKSALWKSWKFELELSIVEDQKNAPDLAAQPSIAGTNSCVVRRSTHRVVALDTTRRRLESQLEAQNERCLFGAAAVTVAVGGLVFEAAVTEAVVAAEEAATNRVMARPRKS